MPDFEFKDVIDDLDEPVTLPGGRKVPRYALLAGVAIVVAVVAYYLSRRRGGGAAQPMAAGVSGAGQTSFVGGESGAAFDSGGGYGGVSSDTVAGNVESALADIRSEFDENLNQREQNLLGTLDSSLATQSQFYDQSLQDIASQIASAPAYQPPPESFAPIDFGAATVPAISDSFFTSPAPVYGDSSLFTPPPSPAQLPVEQAIKPLAKPASPAAQKLASALKGAASIPTKAASIAVKPAQQLANLLKARPVPVVTRPASQKATTATSAFTSLLAGLKARPYTPPMTTPFGYQGGFFGTSPIVSRPFPIRPPVTAPVKRPSPVKPYFGGGSFPVIQPRPITAPKPITPPATSPVYRPPPKPVALAPAPKGTSLQKPR